jgi:hypothetical protein
MNYANFATTQKHKQFNSLHVAHIITHDKNVRVIIMRCFTDSHVCCVSKFGTRYAIGKGVAQRSATITGRDIMATTNTKYQVIWVSPRGFANEGSYVHGSESELDAFCEKFDYTSGMVSTISNHRNSGTAAAAAARLAKRDIKNTPSHEICSIDSLHVSEM